MAPSSQPTVLLAADVPYARSLISQRLKVAGCAVQTAGAADEALRRLERQAPALLVIDLNYPDGASEDLLLRARVQGCTSPVLVLRTDFDRDLLRRLNSLNPVGILRKPLRVEALEELLPLALERHAELLVRSVALATSKGGRSGRSAEEKSAAAALADARINPERLGLMLGQLPVLPHVLTRILAVTGDDTSNATALAEVISSEPRLSGQLLKIVNSAYFGFARRISTIPEAVVILGASTIRQLAVGASVSGFFGGRSTVLDRERLWRHALAAGVASRVAAEAAKLPLAEEAFVGGLLHDFGRLVLERHVGGSYKQVLANARERQVPVLLAERDVLGLDHAWVSGWLANRWNLPGVLAQAMAHHHEPERAAEEHRLITCLVNIGDVLAHLADYGGLADVLPVTEAAPYALGLVGLEAAALPDLTVVVVQMAEQIVSQLGQVPAAT